MKFQDVQLREDNRCAYREARPGIPDRLPIYNHSRPIRSTCRYQGDLFHLEITSGIHVLEGVCSLPSLKSMHMID